jgi:hypothetical protein
MDWSDISTTRYFREVVLNKRPYLKLEWIERVLREQQSTLKQEDGRFRYWGLVKEVGKYLRVILLEDNVTLHNAFFDRNFRELDYEVPLPPRD